MKLSELRSSRTRCYTHDGDIDPKQRAAFRNAVAEEFITLVNNIYGDFEQNELLTRGYIDTAFDVAALGLTAAAAVSSVGNVLGAAGTRTLGWQHSVSKNFYNAQTVVAINSTMHALRLQQLAQIRQREALPIVCDTTTSVNPQNGSQQACYTLEQALNDVQDLYQAGTVQRALIEINNQSASSANTAQSKLATANNQLAGGSTQQPTGITITPLKPQLKAGAKQQFTAGRERAFRLAGGREKSRHRRDRRD